MGEWIAGIVGAVAGGIVSVVVSIVKKQLRRSPPRRERAVKAWINRSGVYFEWFSRAPQLESGDDDDEEDE